MLNKKQIIVTRTGNIDLSKSDTFIVDAKSDIELVISNLIDDDNSVLVRFTVGIKGSQSNIVTFPEGSKFNFDRANLDRTANEINYFNCVSTDGGRTLIWSYTGALPL